ncbi:Glutamate receptor ionotropic, kainate 4 [Chionoecetes opilio]|uniref:Glutamate receptor ionotropic, kainate 4 n=1 Tax=Chionoecetes opilio TaxID=41210 RepID=A0A8J5D389_CHIOP|nr:Glutamate receptor ionotropic, kainate 4 [Chionoecetes opilio]
MDVEMEQERLEQLPPHVNCTQPAGFRGFLVDMLKVISKEMNFTFVIYEVCDKSYGSEEDGRWTGVVGEVVEGRAHLGLANLGANYGRSHAVAFPRISTSYGGAGIIVRRPESTAKDRLTVYMLPFSSGVWAFLLVSIPVAALTMYLATLPRRHLNTRLLRFLAWLGGRGARKRIQSPTPATPVKIFVTSASENATCTRLWEVGGDWDALTLRGEEGRETEGQEEDVPRSFMNGLWFASTVLMQQGQEVVPSSGVARVVFGLVWVSSVILYAAYTSNLVSHFTVTRLSLPVNNLQELVSSDYTFGMRTGSVYIDNLKASNSGVYQIASHKLQSFGTSVFMPTYEDALEKTLQGSYAFIGDNVVLDYYQRKDCNLVLLKQRLFPSMSSIAFPHGSPLLPAFNH